MGLFRFLDSIHRPVVLHLAGSAGPSTLVLETNDPWERKYLDKAYVSKENSMKKLLAHSLADLRQLLEECPSCPIASFDGTIESAPVVVLAFSVQRDCFEQSPTGYHVPRSIDS